MTKKQGKPVFTKEQLLASKRLLDKKDLIMALLQDAKSYTFDEANDLIDKFLSKKVGK